MQNRFPMLSRFYSFVKPFICPGCGDSTSDLVCSVCLPSMRKNHGRIESKDEGVLGLYPIFFSFTHTHRILRHWKTNGGRALERLLFAPSPELLSEIQSMDFQAMVPIPQDPDRCLKRGHASAMVVGRYFSQKLNIPLLTNALILRPERTEKQALLTSWERRFSRNPFDANDSVIRKLKGNILIVDDFITTGATAEKAARTLLEVQPDLKIYVAGLGWKPRTGPRRPEQHPRIESIPESLLNPSSRHRTALPECRIDTQSVQEHTSIQTNHSSEHNPHLQLSV